MQYPRIYVSIITTFIDGQTNKWFYSSGRKKESEVNNRKITNYLLIHEKKNLHDRQTYRPSNLYTEYSLVRSLKW